MRFILAFVALAALASPISAAPPAGPVPVYPPIQGPLIHCLGGGLNVHVPEGANLQIHPMAEVWQPASSTLRLDEGWVGISIDHQRVYKPERSDRVRRIAAYDSGRLFEYQPAEGSTFKMVFIPKKRRDQIVTIAFLSAVDAGSDSFERGWRSTSELTGEDAASVLTLIDFDKPCPNA